jgi:hypothetical protein
MVHRYLELMALGNLEQAHKELPPDVIALCEAIDPDTMPPLSYLVPEAAFAYDTATHTARCIGTNIGREYGELRPFEIPGTADLYGVDQEENIVGVWDYKMGTAEPAYLNSQLKFLALCACLVHGKTRAQGNIVYLRNGKAWTDSAEWDLIELEAFGSELKELLTLSMEKPRILCFSEGPWCRYCPAYSACPAKKALAMELAGGDLGAAKKTGITRSNFAEVYHKLKQADALVEYVRKLVFGFAEREIDEGGPIDLGEGRKLGNIVKNGNEKLDGNIAYQVLRELLFDQDLVDRAVTRTATKKGIEGAIKAGKDEGKVNGVTAERIYNEIRSRGGSQRSVYRKIEEYTEKKT